MPCRTPWIIGKAQEAAQRQMLVERHPRLRKDGGGDPHLSVYIPVTVICRPGQPHRQGLFQECPPLVQSRLSTAQ